MDTFIPFIHQPEKKKEEMEPMPLYIEMYPPPPQEKKKEDEDESRVIIIQL